MVELSVQYFVKRGGTISLICSSELTEEDQLAISSGSATRVTGMPAAFCPAAARVGTICPMFNTMEMGHDSEGYRAIEQSSNRARKSKEVMAVAAGAVCRGRVAGQSGLPGRSGIGRVVYRLSKLLTKVARTPHAPDFIDVGPMAPTPRTAIKAGPAGLALEVRLELGYGLVLHSVLH